MTNILLKIPEGRVGVATRVKYAEGGRMDEACAKALSQIEEKRYDAQLLEDGMEKIVGTWIAVYKKRCRAVCG